MLLRGFSVRIKLKGEVFMNNIETATVTAFLLAFAGVIIFIALIVYIYSAICLQIITNKTNQRPGWMAWVPVANLFLMCKIGKLDYKWLLLLLVPFVPIIGPFFGPICALFWTAFAWYKIAVARGREGWIGAITIIPIVGFFTMGYLAFSK